MSKPLSSFAAEGHTPSLPEVRFRPGTVVALDQALANTGIVLCRFTEKKCQVLTKDMVSPSYSLSGYPAMLGCAVHYKSFLAARLNDHIICGGAQEVVYEQPAARSVFRPESSLLAAYAIELIAEDLNVKASSVQAQVPKTDWASNSRATKAQLRAGIIEKFPELKDQMGRANEHQWDALGIALSHALVRPEKA